MPTRIPSKHLPVAIFRTYPLEEGIRRRVAARRAEEGKTMAAFLRGVIQEQLPTIIAELEVVGVPSSVGESARPARLPLDDQLLAALKSGAKATGIPATRLLAACLQRATQ